MCFADIVVTLFILKENILTVGSKKAGVLEWRNIRWTIYGQGFWNETIFSTVLKGFSLFFSCLTFFTQNF